MLAELFHFIFVSCATECIGITVGITCKLVFRVVAKA